MQEPSVLSLKELGLGGKHSTLIEILGFGGLRLLIWISMLIFEDIVIPGLSNCPELVGGEGSPSDEVVKVAVSNGAPSIPPLIGVEHGGGMTPCLTFCARHD